MKFRNLVFSAIALGATFGARPASAHFLWGEVTSDASPVAKLAFSDAPGQLSEADLVERIQTAKAWNADGQSLEMKTANAVRSGALANGRAFGSSQFYGVLDKTKEGRGIFRLMYYAKSAQTLGEANQNLKLPFELFAQRDGNEQIVVTVKRGALPYTGAALNVYLPYQEKPINFVSDAKGQIHFTSTTPGLYGIKAAWVDETPGEVEGKKYPMTRNYSTLTFRVAASTPAAKNTNPEIPQSGAASMGLAARPQLPPGPHPQVDKAAYELLKNAHDNRQVMPENFPGFSATVTYIKDGVVTNGKLTYRRKGKTEITFDGMDKAEYSWVEDKLMNLIGHRRGGDFNTGDGRYPLSFNALPVNSFGKLIDVNDGMRSEYRVKDNKVTEVTREMGGTRFTISVIETIEADNGKYLANHFIVSYRDAKAGGLKMVEGYRDRYSKIGDVWLPTARFVFTTKAIKPGEADTATFQILKLSDIKMLDASTLASAGQD
jgi:hypothetical protein